jgi:hypothetical protein
VAELIRKAEISEQTFYRCKKQHTGLEVDQVRHLKQLSGRECPAEAAGGRPDPGQDDAAGVAVKKI